MNQRRPARESRDSSQRRPVQPARGVSSTDSTRHAAPTGDGNVARGRSSSDDMGGGDHRRGQNAGQAHVGSQGHSDDDFADDEVFAGDLSDEVYEDDIRGYEGAGDGASADGASADDANEDSAIEDSDDDELDVDGGNGAGQYQRYAAYGQRGDDTDDESEDDDEEFDDGSPLVRLNKYLASHGVASRRGCDLLIADGGVMIDGEIITDLGVKIDPSAHRIEVDGVILKPNDVRHRYYLLNKPSGVVCTNSDRELRPRAIDIISDRDKGRLFTVGRLDEETTGLIILTNDGDFANRVMHPRYGVDKTYEVRVQGYVDDEDVNRIRNGVHLSEGVTSGARVIVMRRAVSHSKLMVTIQEGKNREVRRVFARFGYKVTDLKRIRIGHLSDRGIKVGSWRPLRRAEIEELLAGPTSDTPRPVRRRIGGRTNHRVGAGRAPSDFRPDRRGSGDARTKSGARGGSGAPTEHIASRSTQRGGSGSSRGGSARRGVGAGRGGASRSSGGGQGRPSFGGSSRDGDRDQRVSAGRGGAHSSFGGAGRGDERGSRGGGSRTGGSQGGGSRHGDQRSGEARFVGAGRGSDRGDARGDARGGDRGGDRGGNTYGGRGSHAYGDRGAGRTADRGSARGAERGSDRRSAEYRGSSNDRNDRGNDRGANRGTGGGSHRNQGGSGRSAGAGDRGQQRGNTGGQRRRGETFVTPTGRRVIS